MHTGYVLSPKFNADYSVISYRTKKDHRRCTNSSVVAAGYMWESFQVGEFSMSENLRYILHSFFVVYRVPSHSL